MDAYVYIWFKPDWTPFYVGIGRTPSRWNPKSANLKKRNPLCAKIVSKYGAAHIKVQKITNLTWDAACAIERSLIAHFGRIDAGGTLANFTDGGEGNINPPIEEREKKRARLLDPNNALRNTHILLNTDPEIKAKRIATMRSKETKAKMRAIHDDPKIKAKKLENLQKTIASPEYQAKLALRRKPKPPKKTKAELKKLSAIRLQKLNADPIFKEKRLAALKKASEKISVGVKASMDKRLKTMQTPEVQAKLRKPKSPETKAKIALAKKLWWEKKKQLACSLCSGI